MIERLQCLTSLLALVTVVTHHLAHGSPILLLDVGLVILLVRSATGKSDVFLFAQPFELAVDEFGAVIRVQAQQGIG